MKLDIVIPSYNRAALLECTLDSVLKATVPEWATVGVTVVDNNSTDNTREVVRRFAEKGPGGIRYLFEEKQGRSSALNAGIAASSGELVGMIDDDEEIAPDWIEVALEAFRDDAELEFVGGPYRGLWSAPPPAWLPGDYPAVIGVLDGGPVRFRYDESSPSILPGGNAVIRRATLDRIGHYSEDLGRSGEGLQGAEDVEMYKRLLAAGARGFYLPNLVIHHHVPLERLSKRYFRRWAADHGRSLAVLDEHHPPQVVHLARVPRWIMGQALRSLARIVFRPDRLRTAPDRFFSDELRLREFAGYLQARWFRAA